ncbi:MAG: hypothetical protein NTX82_05745 [Candidatus Parcubacteria bacterium]|nr:hypothetical protein [Candidatus Parcubacteria bacterium]
MNKKIFQCILFVAVISLVLSGCQNSSDNNKVIFYYSLTCPHCKNVEKYISDNNVRDKVKFEEKEVSENKDNAADFGDKILKCGIKPEEAGVPLLWDGSACIVGDEKIINYFFTKINEK